MKKKRKEKNLSDENKKKVSKILETTKMSSTKMKHKKKFRRHFFVNVSRFFSIRKKKII